jgi:membrane glycosyltransferase
MPDFFWWLSPVLAGLVLSIPLSILSSRPEFGRATRALHLFLIPEEIDPPRVLARLVDLLPEPEEDDPLYRHHLAGLRLKARLRGLDALSRKEQMELMLDRFTLEAVAHEFGEEVPLDRSDAALAVTALRPSL